MNKLQPRIDPDDLPQIDVPVINMQDVEHQPADDTRVSNAGVRIPPPLERDEQRDWQREDAEALAEMERIEREQRD